MTSGDAETALAVTDETGNEAGIGATGSGAEAAASGTGGPGLVSLATGGALGLLAGVAVMALVMRRRTQGARQPLG